MHLKNLMKSLQRANMNNEKFVLMIQNGKKEYINELWENVQRFVWQQAYLYAKKNNLPFDDLYQAGFLAVASAVQEYDSKKGILFITFLGTYLKKYFYQTKADFYGWSKGTFEKAIQCEVCSLNEPIYNSRTGDTAELGDTLADSKDYIEFYEDELYLKGLREALDKLLAELPEIERTVIEYRYYNNQSYESISRLLNIDFADCKKHASNGLHKLRQKAMRSTIRHYFYELYCYPSIL